MSADHERWTLVSDGRILGSLDAAEAGLVADFLRSTDLPRLADFFASLQQSDGSPESAAVKFSDLPVGAAFRFPKSDMRIRKTTDGRAACEHPDGTTGIAFTVQPSDLVLPQHNGA